jgi:hypothetical protein
MQESDIFQRLCNFINLGLVNGDIIGVKGWAHSHGGGQSTVLSLLRMTRKYDTKRNIIDLWNLSSVLAEIYYAKNR